MNAKNHKPKKYNLYYIISEKIENEHMPMRLYHDIFSFVIKEIEKAQQEESEEDNEQGYAN